MYRPLGGEIAWWCPSLDDAGNGTTVLDDLIGSNNGTLTNMDPATDWVADTASGGVRALDFDGVNDQVLAGDLSTFSFIQNTHVWSCSTWFKLNSTSAAQTILGNTPFSSTDKGFALYYETGRGLGNGVIRSGVTRGTGVVADTYQFRSPDNSISDTNWHHVCAGMRGPGQPFIFIDGISQTLTVITSSTTLSTGNSTRLLGIGYSPFTSILTPFAGRIDDTRIFNRALTQSEVKALASMRGYQPPQGLGGEIAWWCPTLDTTSFGSGEAIDLSGNGRFAVVENWTSEGSVRYITRLTASNFSVSNNYTWSRWIYLTAPSNNAPVHGFNDTNNRVACLICTGALGGVYTQHGTLANMFQTLGDASLGINTWRHIAFRLVNTSGTNFTSTVWLDGIQVDTRSISGTLRTTLANFTTFQSGISTPTPQRIDDFRFFNRALSDSEIALLASARGYQPRSNTRRRRYAGAYGL